MKLEARKNPLKEVRANHQVAGVIYGKRIDSQPIQVDYKDFMNHYHEYGTSMVFKSKLEGKTHQVYIKDVQVDPLNINNILHFDLIKVTATDTITADIPVHLANKDVVEGRGLVVQLIANTINTEFSPGSGVNSFEIDVKDMEEGDAFYIKDMDIPEGIKVLDDLEKMVVNVSEPEYEEEPEEPTEEENVEVEAIKQKDDEPAEEKEEE